MTTKAKKFTADGAVRKMAFGGFTGQQNRGFGNSFGGGMGGRMGYGGGYGNRMGPMPNQMLGRGMGNGFNSPSGAPPGWAQMRQMGMARHGIEQGMPGRGGPPQPFQLLQGSLGGKYGPPASSPMQQPQIDPMTQMHQMMAVANNTFGASPSIVPPGQQYGMLPPDPFASQRSQLQRGAEGMPAYGSLPSSISGVPPSTTSGATPPPNPNSLQGMFNSFINSSTPSTPSTPSTLPSTTSGAMPPNPTAGPGMSPSASMGGMLSGLGGMKKGGTVRFTKGSGVETRGKTKGKVIKMAKGGNAKIGKRDTKHGRMDLPVASLDKYSGFKKGGIMRKGKRFEEGGVTEGPNAGISDETRARAMRFVESGGASQPAATPRAAPRPAPKAAPKDDNSDAVSRNTSRKSFAPSAPAASKAEDTGRYIGYRASSRALGSRTPEEKEAASERMGEVLGTAASLTPMGRAAGAGKTAYRMANRSGVKAGSDAMKRASAKAKEAADTETRNTSSLSDIKRMRFEDYGGMKKGGNVKESKAMVNKEVAFFKKKGAPKSMIKHEAAEAKEMKYAKGGAIMRPKKAIAADQMKMAPYAKGGGVELRGKTQGKTIKMATGGAVKYARGGGIESRGKTSCKMY